MNAPRFAAAIAGTLVALNAMEAAAQVPQRQVLGWTADGRAVVHLTERGERIVDGVATDYYVEATEVWEATRSPRRALYAHGEPSGAVPDDYAGMQSTEAGATLRTDLQANTAGPANAQGTHRLAWYSRTRIDRPDEKNFVCKRRYRVVLLDAAERRAYTVLDAEAQGELSRRQDEAYCPGLSVDPHWSPDGQAVLAFVTTSSTEATAVRTSELSSLPWAAFTPDSPAAARLSPDTEAGAWAALAGADLDAARAQFAAAGMGSAEALVRAIAQEKQSSKAADKAYEKSAKAPFDDVLRAAAHVAAGSPAKATKWIDEAVARATSYTELLRFASVFELVDPRLASQLAVHALSHPTAGQSDTTEGWLLLARNLLDVGEYSKAEEALGKLATPNPASLALLATIHLDRRETKLATTYAEDLLFENPGHCAAYVVQGRLRALQADNVAARALFEAALACDPGLGEAAFYAADFSRLAGDTARARERFDHYLRVAAARQSDEVRSLRRDAATQWSARLGREGVVLTDVSCRKTGTGALCTGTLKNTTTTAIAEVPVEVVVGKKVVGNATVSIEPGASAPFGVAFEVKKLADATVTAGRDKAERKANQMPAL